MGRDPRYDILFEPIRIGPKVMRNRFYATPHASALDCSAPGAEAYFRGMKADGGWAVVNTGQTEISPEFDYSGYLELSRLWDERDVRNWSLVTQRIHAAGSLAGVELGASGAAAAGYESRLPSRSISGIPDGNVWMGSPYEMDKRDIKQLQSEFAAAARRARSAGFDIVNIHGSELWSICSVFLMSSHNHRTDEYGGSFENRARFWLETLELVREAVGDDCAIAARHCLESFSDGGIRIDEEGVGFIDLADHLVDFWDVEVGNGHWDIQPSRFSGENFQEEWVLKVRPHTAKPIVAVGRFTSPDTMVAVIKSGQQDIIGAARPSIADPFLPAKIDEGRLEEIRECIGCNVCVSRVNVPARIICTQNPTIGEEYRRGWHPERYVPTRSADQSVLVIGAGPAGLECATVLARQGVEYVHLVEGDRQVGGHFRWVPRLPGLTQWIRLIDHRKVITERHRNLAVVTNKRLELEEILDYGAARIIVATGSKWAGDGRNAFSQGPIRGADSSLEHVLTPEQIMVDDKPLPGDRALIYDCEGYFVGASLAEKLALNGRAVTLVTPLPTIAPYMAHTEEIHQMIPRLRELGVELVKGHRIDEISATNVRGHLREYPADRVIWGVDAVVLVTQRVPDDRLYHDLKADPARLAKAGITAVYRTGDCVAARPQVADAIFDAHRLAREIDSPDPMTPLPWIRESRFLATSDRELDQVVDGRVPVQPSSELVGFAG